MATIAAETGHHPNRCYFDQPGGNLHLNGASIVPDGGSTLPYPTTEVSTAINTVGAGTLTAAAIVGGVITRGGAQSGAAFTDTTDTATAIVAALAAATVNQAWELTIINTTNAPETLAAGTGVTLSGITSVAAGSVGRFLVTYTGAGAVSINGLWVGNRNVVFGSGTAAYLGEGNINIQVPGVAGAVAPGATGADNVVAVYSLPANSFDQSLRGITITAAGQFAANGNTKRIKLWWNPATAVVGSTVGAGGSLLADTGAVTTNGGGWEVGGNVFKRGAAGANTQTTTSNGAIAGASHVGVSPPLDATATESGAILIAVTINNTTAVGDASFVWMEVNAMN